MNNMNVDDPYKTLGISHDANETQIRKAYQKLAMKYHPDRRREETTTTSTSSSPPINYEEKMAEINAAYEILKDPDQKRQYDRLYRFGAFGSGGGGGRMNPTSQSSSSYRNDLRRPFPTHPSTRRRSYAPSSSTSSSNFRDGISSHTGSGFTMSYTSNIHDAKTKTRKVIHKTTRFQNGTKYTQTETTTYYVDGRTEHSVSTHEEENATVFGHILKSMLGLSTESSSSSTSSSPSDTKGKNGGNVHHEDVESKNVAWYQNLSNQVKKCVGMN